MYYKPYGLHDPLVNGNMQQSYFRETCAENRHWQHAFGKKLHALKYCFPRTNIIVYIIKYKNKLEWQSLQVCLSEHAVVSASSQLKVVRLTPAQILLLIIIIIIIIMITIIIMIIIIIIHSNQEILRNHCASINAGVYIYITVTITMTIKTIVIVLEKEKNSSNNTNNNNNNNNNKYYYY